MAPPKRKTSGRTTPKGTRPDARPTRTGGDHSDHAGHAGHDGDHEIAASSRYTPKRQAYELESPRWVPILMAVLLGLGALTILLRYVVWTDTNWPVLIGLGFMLGGLYTATKWR